MARGHAEALQAHPAVENVVPIDAGSRGALTRPWAGTLLCRLKRGGGWSNSQGARSGLYVVLVGHEADLNRIDTEIDTVPLIRGLPDDSLT